MVDLNNKTILVSKMRAIGDSVITIAALRFLKDLFPHLNIIYCLPQTQSTLFKTLIGPYDSVIGVDLQKKHKWPIYLYQLLKVKFDFVYEFHQTGSGKVFFSLLSFLKRREYKFYNHNNLEKPNISNIQKDIDGLIESFSLEVKSKRTYSTALKVQRSKKFNQAKKSVVFGVVATRETKMWGIEKFAELALKIENYDPEIEILVPLSRNLIDENLKSELARLKKSKNMQIIQVDLSELPSRISQGKCYIGNDTGLKHLSIALGMKSFTFFGPEDPTEWHPYELNDHQYFFVDKLDCRTMVSHYCPLITCSHMSCLKNFTPEEVFHRLSIESLF